MAYNIGLGNIQSFNRTKVGLKFYNVQITRLAAGQF